MSRSHAIRLLLIAGVAMAASVAVASLAQAQQEPSQGDDASQQYDNGDQSPGRVARLAYLSGQVQFAPAGEDDWGSVEVNRPMVIGDRLLTGDDGLAALELGDASVRIDNGTAFDFLNLTDDNVQIELSQGTLNLAVRQINEGENFEVDTPTVAFVATAPGVFRIDDSPSGTGSIVTVFRGSGMVYGENGASRPVNAGSSYRFDDSTLARVAVNGLPGPDNFDRFCEQRDARLASIQRSDYVPQDMIGADDLYQYGRWDDTPDYGNVWYPAAVPVGWAPYRYGHWAWIDPWGWTWIDDEPWGFAPFHYGRWVYVRNRWGWLPGPVNAHPCYAPALVAFVGGSGFSLSINVGGGPVGWFPLGPRDVYVPWFHASHRYFTRVNVANIRGVYVNRTVMNDFYDDYHAGRPLPRGGRDYAYRRLPAAVTAVPRDVFTGARPVHRAVLRLNRAQLQRSDVAFRPQATPSSRSLGLVHPVRHPAAANGREPFARPVVARHQPPPRPVPFAAREKLIARQQGRPLTAAQVQSLRQARPAGPNGDERVKLVPAARVAGPARRGIAPRQGIAPSGNAGHPVPVPENRGAVRQPPLRPGEMPSARFAHPERRATTLPRPPVLQPAGQPARPVQAPPGRPSANQPSRPNPQAGKLPVVRPIEEARPRATPPRQPAENARQRAFEQQGRMQQEQAQQQARDREMEQQRAAAAQRMQEQRQAQMQREQQAQQPRAMEMQREQRVRQRPERATPPRAPNPRRAPPQRPPPSKKHPQGSGDGHERR
jgi:Family of unknown function (DUF6600)